MEAPKDSRADALLQNLAEQDAEFEEVFWRFRNPDKGGKKLTFETIRAQEVPLRCGFTVSLSTLHSFYRWLAQRRRFKEAEDFAAQARLEMAKDPDIPEEQLNKFYERVLKAESMKERNAKSYVALAKLDLARTKQELDRDKVSAASKTKIEAGLDALLEEIKGNPKALAAFKTIQEEVRK